LGLFKFIVLTRLGKKKKKKKKHTTMAMNGSPRRWDVRLVLTFSLLLISASVSALEHVNHKKIDPTTAETSFLGKVMNFLWSSSGSGYEHTWPVSVLTHLLLLLLWFSSKLFSLSLSDPISLYLVNFIEQWNYWKWTN